MAHVGLDYLDRLPASEVPAYAITAMEREAHETLRWMDLFLIPIEAWAGGRNRPVWQGLRDLALHQLGVTAAARDTRSPEVIEAERLAIAEVEAEIARDFPFYADEDRLDEVHDANGLLRLRVA